MTSLASPVSRKLVCHPLTPCRGLDTIDVRVESKTKGILALTFALHGDLSTLRIPEERPRQWVDDPEATAGDLDALTGPDEAAWMEEIEALRLYA